VTTTLSLFLSANPQRVVVHQLALLTLSLTQPWHVLSLLLLAMLQQGHLHEAHQPILILQRLEHLLR